MTRTHIALILGGSCVLTTLATPVLGQGEGLRISQPDPITLVVSEGEREVLRYNAGMMLKEGVPEEFRRSCYVHPIYGLDGELISDDFPADHFHHRGLYWAWPYVDIGGQRYDLWVCAGIEPRFDAWLEREEGPVAAFGVDAGWYVGDEEAVDEKAWYRIHPSDGVGQAIDVDITFEALGEPVTLTGREDKGYGGFCLRFAPRQDTVITTNERQLAEDSLEEPFEWADLSSLLEGAKEVSGAAIFVHPANPGFPNGWILRHYGFLGCNWPGVGSVTFEPGEPVRLRYRVYIHRGDAEAGRVAEAYEAYRASAQE